MVSRMVVNSAFSKLDGVFGTDRSFRRRIKLGPINLNFSRSGIGASAGAGLFRAGVDAKGRHYTSVRGPFGLYNRQYDAAAKQSSARQTVSTPERVVAKESLVALLFSAGALIVLFNGVVGSDQRTGLVGYFGRKDATNGWFKAVAGLLSIEKWLLVGLLLLLFVVLHAAGSGGRKRR